MKELSCIIIDDEPLAVKLLESFVARTPDLKLAGSFTDSVEAMQKLKDIKVDLAFLDIQMPDVSGMELARVIPPSTRIIFTTAFKEYAFDSYEVSALDFLLKPIRYTKFLGAVEKAREWFGKTQQAEEQHASASVFIKVDGEMRQLQFDSISYVEGMKDYVVFHISGERKSLVTHLTMKSVEELLPPTRFLRVHRSYIVSLDKIEKVDKNDCIYIDGEIIHVTSAYIDAFRSFLESRSI